MLVRTLRRQHANAYLVTNLLSNKVNLSDKDEFSMLLFLKIHRQKFDFFADRHLLLIEVFQIGLTRNR